MRKARESIIQLLPLHAGQIKISRERSSRTVVRAGRRFGKTTMFEQWGCHWALTGKRVGVFAPDYKKLTEVYQNIADTLLPATMGSNKTEMVIDLKVPKYEAKMKRPPGIDFWTLGTEGAGRGRAYHEVIIDEAQLVPDLQDIFEKSIVPTLADFDGNATMGGTPLGMNEENYFYQACTNKQRGEDWPMVWREFHAPSRDNPTLPPAVVARFKTDNAPLVYAQEYEAEFVSWAGQSLLSLDSLTVDGRGVAMPKHVDAIYAVVDTAVKDGKEHDGTAVVYFARSKYVNHPLIILDWDLIQIKSNMLESWIPNVFAQCQYFAKLCHAKPNSQIVVFIEDKASGSMLLQNCAAKGLPAEAIPGNVTSVGKDARVIGCSGAVYRGEVKLSETAFNKATTFKGVTRNHLIRQVCSYAIGDPKSATRADDLSDCASYGILLGLGGVDGF